MCRHDVRRTANERIPIAEKGIVTYGEGIEGGRSRIYYFYPEEYPEIYELKRQQEDVGAGLLSRMLGITRQS